VNILNKQLQAASRGGPPHCKIYHVMKHSTRPWTGIDFLAQPKQCKRDMRFSSWNVRSLHSLIRFVVCL
jgi:hypothetical protein